MKFKMIMISILLVITCSTSIKAEDEIDINSEHAYVMHLDSEKVVFSKNENEKMIPASLTKVMSALVALDKIEDVSKVIEFKEEDFIGLAESGASIAGFLIGEKASLEDILYGMMLPSGADASQAISNEVSGGEAGFVEAMNAKVKELGLENTNFVNTSGLYDEAQYTSAKDMAIILKEALKYPLFVEMFECDEYQSNPTNMHGEGITMTSTRVNALKIIEKSKGVMLGSKTGYTLEGGLCLVSTAKINDATYIVVNGNATGAFNSGNHFKDGYEIYDYLADNYLQKSYYEKDQVVGKVKVNYGEIREIDTYVKDNVNILEPKNDSKIRTEVEYKKVFAPVIEDEEVGNVKVYDGDKEIDSYKIYASDASEKDLGAFIMYIFWNYVIWVIAVIVILYVLIELRRMKIKNRRKMKYKV